MANKNITGTEADKLRRLLFDDIYLKKHRVRQVSNSAAQDDYLARGEILDVSGKLIALDGSALTGTISNSRLNIVKGNWVPVNANVTVTVAGARYWNLDTFTVLTMDLIWPVTADTHVSDITGFPINPGNNCALAVVQGTGILLYAQITPAATIKLFKAGVAQATNADLSNTEVIVSGILL